MFYTKLVIRCSPDYIDILIAELAEAGFETFQELENGVEAYVEEEKYDKEILANIKKKYGPVTSLTFSFYKIEKENWNELWEKSVEPIIVNEQILVRADFHNIEKTYPYEIIITPKMSFGTGHHQTTHLMLKFLLEIDLRKKRVMDVGCGTAILSIMAAKAGAQYIEAFDIDNWSVINGKENIHLNNCNNIEIRQGSIIEFSFSGTFDLIMANINKNVLMEEMKFYASNTSKGGLLLVSGFYFEEVNVIADFASRFSFEKITQGERDHWGCALFKKVA